MANFCTKCGKPLEGRTICPCQMTKQQETVEKTKDPKGYTQERIQCNQQEKQKQYSQINSQEQDLQVNQETTKTQYQQQFNEAKIKSTNYLLELLYTFLDILKKPEKKGSEFIARQRISIMIGLMVVQGILSAFVGMLYANKLSSMLGTLESLVDTFAYDKLSSSLDLHMPMARIAIITVAGSVALSCILAFLVWIAGKVMHIGYNYKQALGVVALRSTILIPVILIAIILALLNPGVGMGCYVIGNVFGFCYMTVGFNTLVTNRSELAPIMLSLVIILFMAAGYFVLTKLSLYYLPDVIRTAISTAKSALDNPSDIIEYIGDLL